MKRRVLPNPSLQRTHVSRSRSFLFAAELDIVSWHMSWARRLLCFARYVWAAPATIVALGLAAFRVPVRGHSARSRRHTRGGLWASGCVRPFRAAVNSASRHRVRPRRPRPEPRGAGEVTGVRTRARTPAREVERSLRRLYIGSCGLQLVMGRHPYRHTSLERRAIGHRAAERPLTPRCSGRSRLRSSSSPLNSISLDTADTRFLHMPHDRFSFSRTASPSGTAQWHTPASAFPCPQATIASLRGLHSPLLPLKRPPGRSFPSIAPRVVLESYAEEAFGVLFHDIAGPASYDITRVLERHVELEAALALGWSSTGRVS